MKLLFSWAPYPPKKAERERRKAAVVAAAKIYSPLILRRLEFETTPGKYLCLKSRTSFIGKGSQEAPLVKYRRRLRANIQIIGLDKGIYLRLYAVLLLCVGQWRESTHEWPL